MSLGVGERWGHRVRDEAWDGVPGWESSACVSCVSPSPGDTTLLHLPSPFYETGRLFLTS